MYMKHCIYIFLFLLYLNQIDFHSRLTSTTVASPGCSTKRDGLTAKGGCSEKYVLATDYIKKEKQRTCQAHEGSVFFQYKT